MRSKSLLVLGLISAMITINSCSTDAYVTPESIALDKQFPTASQTTTAAVDLYNYSYSTSENQFVDIINAHRVSIGLPALVKANYISLKAEGHNNYMISTTILSHNDFTVRAEDIMKTLDAISVGENVAYNSSTAQAAFDAWMASPGHKANIEGAYTSFGVSIRVDSATGRKYYTNIFAKM